MAWEKRAVEIALGMADGDYEIAGLKPFFPSKSSSLDKLFESVVREIKDVGEVADPGRIGVAESDRQFDMKLNSDKSILGLGWLVVSHLYEACFSILQGLTSKADSSKSMPHFSGMVTRSDGRPI